MNFFGFRKASKDQVEAQIIGQDEVEAKAESSSCGCGCGCSTRNAADAPLPPAATAPAAQDAAAADGAGADAAVGDSAGHVILVLGSGCRNCKMLETNTRTALAQMNRTSVRLDYVSDIARIASYGVMSTPALVLDGKVLTYGRVLTAAEIMNLLQDKLD